MRDLLAELFAHCASDSLSEDGLREIIERHGCAPNNPDIRKYDFFRKACQNERVTDGIIRCLLEYFPGAASVINQQTPLHILCRNKKNCHTRNRAPPHRRVSRLFASRR